MKKSDETLNSLSPAIPVEARYVLISVALGFLGLINTVLIGVHVATLYLRLAELNGFFLTKTYVIGGVTVASAFILVFGNYLIWKGKGRRGGVLNLAAGVVTLVLFCYFAWVFPLLRQFEPAGYLLPVPALTSGLTALFALKKSPNHS
jgi:hypothetical protein